MGGAHNGNMFAILSMYFVCSKRTLPKLSPIDIPSGGILVLSGASAGMLYKSMHPPAMIAKWGMVGAALPSVYVLLEYLQDEGILWVRFVDQRRVGVFWNAVNEH